MLRAPKDDLRSLFLPSFNIKRNIDRHLVLLSEIISRLRWKKELRAKMISCETHHSKKKAWCTPETCVWSEREAKFLSKKQLDRVWTSQLIWLLLPTSGFLEKLITSTWTMSRQSRRSSKGFFTPRRVFRLFFLLANFASANYFSSLCSHCTHSSVFCEDIRHGRKASRAMLHKKWTRTHQIAFRVNLKPQMVVLFRVTMHSVPCSTLAASDTLCVLTMTTSPPTV